MVNIIIAFCLYCRNFSLDCDARDRDAVGGRHASDCVDRILSNGFDDVDVLDADRLARDAFDLDHDAFDPALDASGDRDDFVATVG